MSASLERFIAGEDRLAALLRELPQYEPDATLEAHFIAAAHQAQAQHVAPPAFEPPQNMETDFRNMAAAIDAAQQDRRQAILHDIAAGKSIDVAMGGSIDEAGQKWLTQQIPATPATPARRRWPRLNWRDIQIVGLAAILAAWCTHFYLQRRPTSTEMVMLDAFRQASEVAADDEQDESSSIAAKVEESIQANLQHHAASPEHATPRSTMANIHPSSVGKSVPARITETSPSAARAPRASEPASALAAPAVVPADAPHEAGDMHATANTEPVARLSMAPVQQSGVQSDSDSEPHAEKLPQRAERFGGPAAVTAMAPQPHHSLHATLRDDPVDIATRLSGTESEIYTLSCANPEDPTVLAWIDGLRHALHARGEKILVRVRKNAGIAEGGLLIQAAPE